MTISSSINNFNSINNSLFNTLYQGQVSMYAAKLSNSKFLFPENAAPGKGSLSTGDVSYIGDLKTAANDLSAALSELSGSAWNKSGLVASDSSVLSAKYTGTSSNFSKFEDMKVKVDQIATGQLNEGDSMKASGTYSGNLGTNRFSIETGGKTTQLSVNVSVTDKNIDVQNKMAKAINDAGLGLKATVETDSKTGNSTLRIEAENTGSDAKNAFTIKDTTGNIVEKTGTGERTRAGQDAVYSVNGGPQQTSKTNTVDLGNGVSATLKAASGQEVTISRGNDKSAAINAVKDMVSSYNKLFDAAFGNVGDPKAQNLASRLLNITSVYSRALSDVGIGFDTSGKLTIDSERLDKAAENGSLEKFFTENNGKNYGFSNTLGRLANNVANNTSSFVTNNIFGSVSDIFSYSGFGSVQQMNTLGTGSLFDFSF